MGIFYARNGLFCVEAEMNIQVASVYELREAYRTFSSEERKSHENYFNINNEISGDPYSSHLTAIELVLFERK